MPTVRPTLEFVHSEGQAGGAFGQIGRVNLRQVAHADDLGAGSGAGDQRFHLLGRQVLGLVDDDVLGQKRAAPHEVHALDLDTAADQFAGGGAAPFASVGVGFAQHFKVVIQCAHPRAHFFFFSAGQKADVFAHAHGRAGDDDFCVAAVIQHLGKAGSQRHQRLA